MTLIAKRMAHEQLVESGLVRADTFADTTPVRIGQESRVVGTTPDVAGVYLLPPASTRIGDTIRISCVITDGGTVTVKDCAANAGAAGTELSEACVLDTTLDYVIVWSDGVVWNVIASNMA